MPGEVTPRHGVMTLCNHLASRELEIERWSEFSDTSAEKLDQAKHEYISICCAKDDALNAVQTMLVNVGTEVLRAKKEMSKTRAEVVDILLSTAFPSVLCDVEKLRHQIIQRYCSDVQSECKLETRHATDKLTTAHCNDKTVFRKRNRQSGTSIQGGGGEGEVFTMSAHQHLRC